MGDRIVVRGLRVLGRHGVHQHEREHPQPFDVSVELDADLRKAITSDGIADTIDYALVVREIRRVVDEESFALIEVLADAIARRLLAFGAARVRVRVAKPAVAAALGAEEIAVVVERA